MCMPAAGFVKLESGAAREPYSGDASVVEGGSKFIEARDALPMERNQAIDGDVKDIGCLTQAGSENHSNGNDPIRRPAGSNSILIL